MTGVSHVLWGEWYRVQQDCACEHNHMGTSIHAMLFTRCVHIHDTTGLHLAF